jgi:hypothetical protein
MASSEHYRRLARACIQIARDSKNPADRAMLTAMAEAWIRLAEQIEQRAPTDEDIHRNEC